MASVMLQQSPPEIIQRTRSAFLIGRPHKIQFRESQLQAFLRLLDENEIRLQNAVYADLRKPPIETSVTEIDLVRNEIRRALNKIWDWHKPKAPTKGISNCLDIVQVRKDPYGVVLIIGSWSCPVLQLLRPFVGALAAGNCVVLKPSEKAYTTAMLITELIERYLDNECYQVFNGGAVETTALLCQRFDYIFFTGSEHAAKIIRGLSNQFLTPVTLALGGKCPTFVDDNVNLNILARRIAWGKLLNAGQTCVAPDYIICSKSIEEHLITAMQTAIIDLLGPDPRISSFYARIINDEHYERLVQMMADGKVALGGQCDPYERYIAPTIITNVDHDSLIMTEEIFGPILPIINLNGPGEAIDFISSRSKPLAIYVFTKSKSTIDKFLMGTCSGTVVVNDVGVQVSTDNVPLGGVGQSGMGSYGGRYSFEAFTHRKTCIMRDLGYLSEKLGSMRYPPYSSGAVNFIRIISKQRNYPPLAWMKNYLIFCLGIAVAAAYYYYSE